MTVKAIVKVAVKTEAAAMVKVAAIVKVAVRAEHCSRTGLPRKCRLLPSFCRVRYLHVVVVVVDANSLEPTFKYCQSSGPCARAQGWTDLRSDGLTIFCMSRLSRGRTVVTGTQ
jgi:hypothetical protein